jgi:hypothetical protein
MKYLLIISFAFVFGELSAQDTGRCFETDAEYQSYTDSVKRNFSSLSVFELPDTISHSDYDEYSIDFIKNQPEMSCESKNIIMQFEDFRLGNKPILWKNCKAGILKLKNGEERKMYITEYADLLAFRIEGVCYYFILVEENSKWKKILKCINK